MNKSDGSERPREELVIVRTFDASLERVFRAWSEAGELQSWWGPAGCKIEVGLLEFRRGGFFHYAMTYTTGAAMWGRFLYRDIVPGSRICWLNSFSNPECGITRAPFDAAFPLEVENMADFTADGGKTRVVLTVRPHGAPAAERAAFMALYSSMQHGYGATLEALASHLTAG